jgi:RecA/RadA recombinase
MKESIYMKENGKVRWEIIVPRREGFTYEPVVYNSEQARCKDSYFVTPLELAAEPGAGSLVEGILSQSSMAVVYGPSGVGKSFLALDMALTIASGLGSWHGHRTESGSVVYIAGEGSEGVQKRIRAWQLANGVQSDACEGLLLRKWAVDFLERRAIEELATEIAIRSDSVKLIVIDTLARCFGPGDENAARDMNLFVQHLDFLRQKTGATVLPLHHTGKEVTRGARGSTALHAAADTMLELQSSGKRVLLACKKQKDGEEFKPMRFQMVESGESVVLSLLAGQSVDAMTSSTELVALQAVADHRQEGGALKRDIQESTNLSRGSLQRLLSALVNRQLLTTDGAPTSPYRRYLLTLHGEAQLRLASSEHRNKRSDTEESVHAG